MKRKILMITPYLPYPLASGGQIRTYNLLKHLSQKNEVHLISLYKKENNLRFIPELTKTVYKIYPCKRAKNPWQPKLLLKGLLSPYPYLVVRNFSNEAKKTITELLKQEQFDIIHAETFYVMPLIPKTSVPILLAEQTIEFMVYQKFAKQLPFPIRFPFHLEIFKLKFWEKYFWKKATLVAPVSKLDEKIIRSIAPQVKTAIIPNGAGDEMFVKRLPKRDLKTPLLLFIGNFLWLQNQEPAIFLMEKLAPLLLKHIPKAKIIIAGQHLNEKLKFSKISKNVQLIDIKENESEKIKQLYQKATLFLAPITGPGGTRLKILAAMAAGLPIIATKTAVEGLGLENGAHYLKADTPKQYLNQIKTMLNKEEVYRRIQTNAWKLAKQEYSWEKIAQKLEKIYERLENKNHN